MTTARQPRPLLIDTVLPEYQFSDVTRVVIEGEADDIFRVFRTLRLRDLRTMRALFWLRELPARLLGAQQMKAPLDIPWLEMAVGPDSPWIALGGTPDREVVMGAAGKFCQMKIEFVSIPDAEAFLAFDDPGCEKTILGVRIEPLDDTGLRHALVAESRTHVPDPQRRRRFRFYWAVVQPGEKLMTRGMLNEVRRRVEAGLTARGERPPQRRVPAVAGLAALAAIGAGIAGWRRSRTPAH